MKGIHLDSLYAFFGFALLLACIPSVLEADTSGMCDEWWCTDCGFNCDDGTCETCHPSQVTVGNIVYSYCGCQYEFAYLVPPCCKIRGVSDPSKPKVDWEPYGECSDSPGFDCGSSGQVCDDYEYMEGIWKAHCIYN